MGECLVYVLTVTLKDDMTPTVKECWIETYKALSSDMIRAQVKMSNRRR